MDGDREDDRSGSKHDSGEGEGEEGDPFIGVKKGEGVGEGGLVEILSMISKEISGMNVSIDKLNQETRSSHQNDEHEEDKEGKGVFNADRGLQEDHR